MTAAAKCHLQSGPLQTRTTFAYSKEPPAKPRRPLPTIDACLTTKSLCHDVLVHVEDGDPSSRDGCGWRCAYASKGSEGRIGD